MRELGFKPRSCRVRRTCITNIFVGAALGYAYKVRWSLDPSFFDALVHLTLGYPVLSCAILVFEKFGATCSRTVIPGLFLTGTQYGLFAALWYYDRGTLSMTRMGGWLLLMSLSGGVIGVAIDAIDRHLRRSQSDSVEPTCQYCGYSLYCLLEKRCPECGRRFQ